MVGTIYARAYAVYIFFSSQSSFAAGAAAIRGSRKRSPYMNSISHIGTVFTQRAEKGKSNDPRGIRVY